MINNNFFSKMINLFRKPIFISITFFVICSSMVFLIITPYSDRLREEQREKLSQYITTLSDDLQFEIYSRFDATKAVSAFISNNPNLTSNEYEHYIKSLAYFWTGVIHTMAFSKGNIVTYVAPDANNSSKHILGFDLYADSARKKGLEECRKGKVPFVEGPRYLIDTDTLAIIAYIPIFINDNEDDEPSFYGFADVSLLWDKVVEAADLKRYDTIYDVAIRGINGLGEAGAPFYGDSTLFEKSDIHKSTIKLPIGEWCIAARPHNGFENANITFIVIGVIIAILSIIIFFVVKHLLFVFSENAEKYKTITENTHDVIWNLDINTMKFTYISSSIFYINGFTAAELLLKPLKEIFSSASMVRIMDEINNMINAYNFHTLGGINTARSTFEIQIIHKNGGLVDGEVSANLSISKFGKIIGISGVTRDITTRKNLEREILESEKKYKMIAENTNDAIWIADLKTRKYKYMSYASVLVLGYQPSEMVGHSVEEFVPVESIEPIKAHLDQEMVRFIRGETDKIRSIYEVQKYNKYGELVWLEVAETILHDENNNFNEILGVSRRIDQRKINEFEVMKQQQELKTLNATKDKFFSIVAHDLKNPIAALINIVQILYDYHRQLSEEDIEKNILRLYQTSDHIYKLLESLLQWARSSSGAMAYLPMHQNIMNIMKEVSEYLTEQAATKNILISVETLTKETNVICDTNMIETVIRNLLSNAIKFSNSGSTIKLVVADDKDNDFVKISVIDSGVGIPADKLEKLFKIDEKVTTLGTNKEIGTGLGLILCKEFIDKHNCKIGVESVLDVGTTFSFTLQKVT